MLNIPEFDQLNKSFIDRNFDWAMIKNNCRHFYILNSDDDPYVPIEKGELLAKKLATNLTIISGAGHFNQQAGYNTFPYLLNLIKSEHQIV